MNPNILTTLKTQSTFGLTGKINILLTQNSRFLASIFYLEGKIVNAKYKNFIGAKALKYIILDEIFLRPSVKYIIEPEIISADQKKVDYSITEFEQIASSLKKEYAEYISKRPPENLVLNINPNFIISGENISYEEFETLLTMSKYSDVIDIYKNTQLHPLEATKALVDLRKKKAIFVIGQT